MPGTGATLPADREGEVSAPPTPPLVIYFWPANMPRMTGGNPLPVAAVFVGVLAANVALAWFLARRNWEPPEALGPPGDSSPSESESASETDPDGPLAAGPEFAVGADADSAATETDPDGDPPPLDADGETVVCRHCGAENRPEFRYCRWCVRSGFADDSPGAGGGSTMTERSL